MNHNYKAKYADTFLRPLQRDDIENLRQWRNNKTDTKFLTPLKYITPEMQAKWYESYLTNASEYIFAIVEDSELHRMVGSVAIYEYNPDNHTAEIGKIQIGDPEAHGRGIGRKALVMAMKIGFQKLDIQKFVGEVHQDNISARTNDQKVGFKFIGTQKALVGGLEDLLEATQEDLAVANHYYSDIQIEG